MLRRSEDQAVRFPPGSINLPEGRLVEARAGIEPAIMVLQTMALPLGDLAVLIVGAYDGLE